MSELMTEHDAMVDLIEGIQAYYERNGKEPTYINMPMSLAFQLLKLPGSRIGVDYAAALWLRGCVVFEEQGLLGMHVRLDRAPDAVLSFTHNYTRS